MKCMIKSLIYCVKQMTPKTFEIVDLEPITDPKELDRLNEKLMEYLENKGLIYEPTKKNEGEETKIIKDRAELKELIKKHNAKLIKDYKELSALKDNTHIYFGAKVDTIGFKLSPRIRLLDFNGIEEPFHTAFLDNKIIFDEGIIKFNNAGNTKDVLNYFNKLISIFNIFSIPLDFVHDYELITFMKGMDTNIRAFSSIRAENRGNEYEIIDMDMEEFCNIILSANMVWNFIKKSEMINDIFIFLGYGKYYHFHEDYLLSFANSWMFVEAIINLMWEKMMRENGFTKRYVKNVERNWTLQIKIDQLFLKDYLDQRTKEILQRLRTKRNNVFHVSQKEEKRQLNAEVSQECIDIGLSLFYNILNFIKPGHIISFDNIALAMKKSIHQNPFHEKF